MIPLPDIVLIVIRLFVINWALWAVGTLVMALGGAFGPQPFHGSQLIPPVGLAVFAFLGWVLAPAIAQAVTPPKDYAVNVGGLGLRDLYAFAFVFLGLYFVLSSVAATLMSVYFFWVSTQGPRQSIDPTAMDETFKHAVTLIVGFFVMINAGRLSELLVRKPSSR